MENHDLAIPFSCTFRISKIHDFRPFDLAISAKMTVIMRIKFTGLPNKREVMEYIKQDNLLCKVHEDESVLFDGQAR